MYSFFFTENEKQSTESFVMFFIKLRLINKFINQEDKNDHIQHTFF
jgi:hypothetical protein